MMLLLSLLCLCVTQNTLQLPFYFFFLLVFFPLAFLDELPNSFNKLLPRKLKIKIGPISLDTRNKVCVTNFFEDVICDVFDSCSTMSFTFALFTVTSIHNIQKYTKTGNSKKRWTVTQKIQDSRDREIDLISTKVWRKMRKMFKRRNWLIHKVKLILTLLLKNSSHQKTG